MKTGAVILAAGGASRFGAAKQLLKFEGVTLIDKACATAAAAGSDPIVRVLGSRAGEIMEHPVLPGVETLIHPHWREGMGSSLAAGIARLREMAPDCDAVFILLSDQPLVTRELLERMKIELTAPATSIILCNYGPSQGPPALFANRHFSELADLQGDRGAKSLVASHPDAARSVDFPNGIWDIDSPETWQRFLNMRPESAQS